jgi:hypothetical protein
MPAISRPIVWTCYTLNVITDLYLISLPVPFLWEARMKTWKKVGLGILFSGGFIVIAFATARCVLLTTVRLYFSINARCLANSRQSKGNASPLAGRWALREAFVAIVTANLPMAFTLVKGLLGPTFWSTRRSAGTELNTMRKGSSRTSGGGGPSGRIRGGLSVVPITTYALFSESEERIYTEQPAHQERDMPTMPKSALSLQWRDMTDDAQVNTREAFGNRL